MVSFSKGVVIYLCWSVPASSTVVDFPFSTMLGRGTLPEGEGSVQLTFLY